MTLRTLEYLVSALHSPAGIVDTAPLSIEELQAGLRKFDCGDLSPSAFWDENVEAFRQTVLVALRETSEALLWLPMSENARAELETQLPALRGYIELADAYVAGRVRGSAPSGLTH